MSELSALATAVDDVALPVDGELLAGAFAVRSRFEARLVRSIIGWEASGLWGPAGDGSPNPTEWVRHRCRLPRPEAVRLVGLARLCAESPVLHAAWEAGRLSSAQVAAVRANVPRVLLGLWSDHEADVVPLIEPLDDRHTATAMQAWAMRARAQLDIDPPDPATDRTCHLEPTLDGTARLTAHLTPEAAAIAHSALRKAAEAPTAGDLRTPAQKTHDALVHIFASFLDTSDRNASSQHRPHLNVVVDLATLRSGVGTATHLDSGITISAEQARLIACDCDLHTVYRSAATILRYGRSQRSVPASVATAVAIRDGGCRGPGCTRPISQTRGHHIHFWEDGGPTDPENIAALCSFHHWLAHQPGWHVAMDPDGTCTWTPPVGAVQRTRPHPRVGGGPADRLVA